MDPSKLKALGNKLKNRHNSEAEYFLKLSIILIASLRSISKIKSGGEFPPDDETIQYVSDSIDYLLNALEIDLTKLRKDLFDFFDCGLEKLSNIQLNDKKSFQLLAKFCLYVRKLYLSFNSYKNIIESVDTIRHLDNLALATDKKAAELLAYWAAKSKEMKASLPGVLAKSKKMQARIDQVKVEIEKLGVIADESIEISKRKWTDIFKDLEIYSTDTKRKYKKIIEDELSKEIKIKK